MKLFRILAGGLCFAVVIGFLSVVFLVGSAIVWSASTSIGQRAVNEIEEGMTRAEVVKWIGPPHEQDVYGRWHYRVFGASDMLHVEFDEKDRVKTVCF